MTLDLGKIVTTTRMDPRAVERFATLLNEHGSAAYGDEWWPGRADAWMDDGRMLSDFCDGELAISSERECAEVIDLFERYGRTKFGSGRFGPEFDLTDAQGTIGPRKAARLRAISDRARDVLAA